MEEDENYNDMVKIVQYKNEESWQKERFILWKILFIKKFC